MMKKLSWALVAALLIPLAACQFPAGNTGSLKVQLPSPRAVASGNGDGDTVRIQLIRNGVVIPLDGQDYLEEGNAGQTITLSDLSVGSGYTLNVATGEDENGYFEVAYFNTSDKFEISAGVDTKVNVTLKPAPFSLLEATADSGHGVAGFRNSSSSYLAYLDGTSLKTVGSVTTQVPISSIYDAGAKINSLAIVQKLPDSGSFNVDEKYLFLSTDKGIAWTTGSSPALTMVHDVDGVTAAQSFNPETWFSGSFAAGTSVVYVYGGPGLSAGLAVVSGDDSEVPATPSSMRWFDLEGLLGIDGMDTVKNALEGGNPAITGFASATSEAGVDQWAWLATALGTFRIEGSMITDGTEELGNQFQDMDPAVMIEAVLDGRTVPIDTVAAADGRGYAGTAKGLFTEAVSANGQVSNFGSTQKNYLRTLVPGTLNLSITQVSAYKRGTSVYAAAYTPTTQEVFIMSGATVIKRFPVFAGLPQGELKFAWWVEASKLKLAIAGDDATVTYAVD